jgi:oligopeptide transport system permease protein
VLGFLLGRLAGGVAVLLAVATLCFFLLHAAPGGPFDDEARVAPEVQELIRQRYHLDEPVTAQYLRYLGALGRGDLGHSLKRPQAVADLIAARFPVSAALGALALAFALVLGVAAGALAARRRGSWPELAASLLSLLGLTLPAFVLGPLLISLFALRLGLFPPARLDGPSSLVLPALSLGLAYAAIISRLARAGLLEILAQDYVRTARAKGLPERTILWKHAARLGLVPVLAYLGPASAALVGGSFVVEKIFALPGLGTAFVTSIADRDYPVMTGVFLFYAALVVLANLASDLVHLAVDPRLRAGDAASDLAPKRATGEPGR